jgi:hypothetical protein
MRTTVDLSDDIYRRAKSMAAERGTTLRALIEAALHRELDRTRRADGFRLVNASVRGKGLQAGVDERDFRELAYEGIDG